MTVRFRKYYLGLATGFCLLMAAPHQAVADAGKDAQNPLGNLISVPVELDIKTNIGPFDRDQYQLTFKPVVPFDLGGGWTFITRTIIPTFIEKPIVTTPNSDDSGLGDINPSLFFVAPPMGKWTIGAGPQFILPTASKSSLGSEKWTAGPAVVVVYTPENIVTGALFGQVWSFADASGGSSRVDTDLMTIQPFFNYNFKDHPGLFVFTNPVISANWNASSGNKWTVPLGGGVGKTFMIGSQHMQFKAAAFYNVVRPSGGPDWQIQTSLNFLFPEKK